MLSSAPIFFQLNEWLAENRVQRYKKMSMQTRKMHFLLFFVFGFH